MRHSRHHATSLHAPKPGAMKGKVEKVSVPKAKKPKMPKMSSKTKMDYPS